MEKAKRYHAAIEAVPAPEEVQEEHELVEEIVEEVVTIDQVILLEKIPDYRFVDENGRMFRLELHSSGVYWLYPV